MLRGPIYDEKQLAADLDQWHIECPESKDIAVFAWNFGQDCADDPGTPDRAVLQEYYWAPIEVIQTGGVPAEVLRQFSWAVVMRRKETA